MRSTASALAPVLVSIAPGESARSSGVLIGRVEWRVVIVASGVDPCPDTHHSARHGPAAPGSERLNARDQGPGQVPGPMTPARCRGPTAATYGTS
ncbi:hypothetical protein GCM10022225_52340 [Plantactinospora mayteni]|uniref:Secreted protein n=1 Tax=Plantactinospora mayteni TaxID=566021 RepID=A0ABQ4EYW8_9ACTN|nr:hypothetical protein Pma05_64220 [Plantactinospora mayteni]